MHLVIARSDSDVAIQKRFQNWVASPFGLAMTIPLTRRAN